MDTQTMLSGLEANGRISMSMRTAGDLFDIDRRIKEGDESGWRGDPAMGIFINTTSGNFEVWGIDRGGNDYMAASHDKLDHTLLTKLRDGDPTRNDVIQNVLDANAKMEADRATANSELTRELGEKMQWAIRRDLAGHLGGRGSVHAITRKVGG